MNDDDGELRQLLATCVLQDIVVRQLSARLRTREESEASGLKEDEASLNFGMAFEQNDGHTDFIFNAAVLGRIVEANSEVVVRYELASIDLSEDLAVAFATRVAFFAAYPYMREVLHSSTGRLPGTQAFILPIVQDPPQFQRNDRLVES